MLENKSFSQHERSLESHSCDHPRTCIRVNFHYGIQKPDGVSKDVVVSTTGQASGNKAGKKFVSSSAITLSSIHSAGPTICTETGGSDIEIPIIIIHGI